MFIELWLQPGDTFRLVRNGTQFTHDRFPVIKDPVRGEVNVAFPEEARVQQQTLTFLSGVHSISKSIDHNEDATFRTRNSIGLADGVSAWRKSGIDGGLFSKELMRNCATMAPFLDSATATLDTSSTCNSLPDMLEKAYHRGTAVGSSTVVIAHLNHQEIQLYNLGDSQAVLIRFYGDSPTIIQRTQPKMHFFSSPYQLARLPLWAHQTSFLQDSVFDGDLYTTTVQTGDLLLMASDGLWDNLFESEILSLVQGMEKSRRGAKLVAEMLATAAFRRSHSGDPSPFQRQVEKQYGPGHWRGGKPDDISVVAAWVATSCYK